MPLSGAAIDNLEKLGRCFDAGYLSDPTHKEAIKKHAIQNKVVDADFWSHLERLSGLLSSGVLTADEHKKEVASKVAALVGAGDSRSATAAVATGGSRGEDESQVPEKTQPAQKNKGKRKSVDARAAANTRHGNIINCWAQATQQSVSRMLLALPLDAVQVLGVSRNTGVLLYRSSTYKHKSYANLAGGDIWRCSNVLLFEK